MKVSALLDSVELTCKNVLGKQAPNRFEMLKWMSEDLNQLTSKCPADWFLVHLDPAVMTKEGVRDYDLPHNFPDNFVRHAGQRFFQYLVWGGDKWCCLLDDGTNSMQINYEAPMQFYSRNLRGESNSRPIVYTITSQLSGDKRLSLSPPPDANGTVGYYTVNGLYLPTDWHLTYETDLPPIPENCVILSYYLLARLAPNVYEAKAADAYESMMFNAASNRVAQFVPVLGRSGRDEYTLQSRRR